jgi:hypothetical protein
MLFLNMTTNYKKEIVRRVGLPVAAQKKKSMQLLKNNLHRWQQPLRLPLLMVLPFLAMNLVAFPVPLPLTEVKHLLALPPPLLSKVRSTLLQGPRSSTLSIPTLSSIQVLAL